MLMLGSLSGRGRGWAGEVAAWASASSRKKERHRASFSSSVVEFISGLASRKNAHGVHDAKFYPDL